MCYWIPACHAFENVHRRQLLKVEYPVSRLSGITARGAVYFGFGFLIDFAEEASHLVVDDVIAVVELSPQSNSGFVQVLKRTDIQFADFVVVEAGYYALKFL